MRPEVSDALENVAGEPLPPLSELENICEDFGGDFASNFFGPIFGGEGSPFGGSNLIFPPLNMLSLLSCGP